jgi:hypothetical protein
MGFPQQASMHRHEIVCQRLTPQPKLAYAQEASTVAIHHNTIAYGQKIQFAPDKDTLPPCCQNASKAFKKLLGPDFIMQELLITSC